ncbi:hypothetical protein ABPG74_007239 [Tetrahymena malaccensis]
MVLQAIKQIDIYGIPVGVNFKNQQIYKTLLGALITVLITIIFVLQCYFSGQNLFQRNDPQVITSEQYVRNPERMNIDNKQQTIMMGLQLDLTNTIYDPSIIQVTAQQAIKNTTFNQTSQTNQTSFYLLPLKIRPCELKDVQNDEVSSFFKNLPLNKLFCFDDNQEIYIEGDYSGDIYSRIDVYFNQCANSTAVDSVICKPQEVIDKSLQNFSFLVYMIDKILDPRQFDQPFDYHGVNIITQASNKQSIQYTTYFENYYIESDIGLVNQDINLKRDFILAGTDTNIVYNTPNLVLQFTMRPQKNKQLMMQRKYTKITDLIAQLSGTLKLLTIVGFLLSYPFAKMNLRREMIDSIFDYEELESYKNSQSIQQESKSLQGQKQIDHNSINFQQHYENRKDVENQNIQFSNNVQESNQTEQFNCNKSFMENLSPKAFISQNKSVSLNQMPKNITSSSNQQSNQIFSQSLNTQNQKKSEYLSNNQQKMLDNQQNKVLSENQSLNNKKSKLEISIFQKIQMLLNPVKNLARFNLTDYIKYYCCCFSKRKSLINEGMKKLETRLDIQNIFHQLQEIEKLKRIILDEDQIKLFEVLPRPVLRKSQSEAQKHYGNSYFDLKAKPDEEKVDEAYNSLMKIVKRQKKSQRDLQLIQLLDENIYLNLQNKGLLKRKNQSDENSLGQYSAKDEIIESNSINQEIQESDIQTQEQCINQEQEVVISPFRIVFAEEGTIKSDKYFKFKKKNIKNS